MTVPLFYTLRNLWTRKWTTGLTAAGMGLVVFVFSAMLMMAEGLRKTLVDTGSPDQVVVIRRSAGTEVQSGIDRYQASIVETQPEVAIAEDGGPLLSKEAVVIVSLPKRGSRKEAYITVRGIGTKSLALRRQVRLIAGQLPKPGSSEILASQSVAKRCEGGGLGETLHFGLRSWRVVGIFDAGNTSFSSEIWADVDQLMQTFRRNAYSSILFRLRDPTQFERLKLRIESDPRLTLEAKRETRYYADQSELMAKFLRILGFSLTIIFSLGAIIGAMITMYGAVATRTSEIATLQALGFQRRTILLAFIVESLLLGATGGVVGLFFASFLRFLTVSTMNFQTFSELTFQLTLNVDTIVKAMAFAWIMGFAGGVFPALRASRMNIVQALRAT